MKKILIFAISLAFFSCSEDDSNQNDIPQNDQQTFEDYNDINAFVTDLEKLSERSSDQVQNASKNNNGACFTLELLVSNTENPLPGFEDFDFYNKMIIDQTTDDCIFKDWGGKLEYYVAGIPNNKWKDSTVYKNVQYRDRRIYNGYRKSVLVPEMSNEEVQVYDVLIFGTIQGLDGDIYDYISVRNFEFRNRFTSDETITLKTGSSLISTTRPYSIYEDTLEGEPLIFKANCFEGFNFLKYPVSGSQDFSSNFGINFNIDYGDGSCDKQAVLTPVGGEPITIEL